MIKPVFYLCEICGHDHPWEWDGDCRDDANRFTAEALDAKYGYGGWDELDMASRVEADTKPQGVYGEMCRSPELCAGKGYCPRDPACNE